MTDKKVMKTLLLKEELDVSDIKIIKELISKQLKKLFYQLYVKKAFWEG